MNRGAHEDSGLPRPTAAELRVLRALWRLGPSTVRQVHEALPARSTTGYTTVLKFLQIMYQKGLVERDDTQRAHIYRPAMSKEQTQTQLTTHLIDRVFDGSRSKLVLHALGDTASPEELEQIRAMLARLEEERQ